MQKFVEWDFVKVILRPSAWSLLGATSFACLAGAAFPGVADVQATVHLRDVLMRPIGDSAAYNCEDPSIPVQFHFHEVVRDPSFNPLHFKNDAPETSGSEGVVVRRAGQIEPEKKEPRWSRKVSSARFSDAWKGRGEVAKLADLTMGGTLYFCTFEGFPQFVRGKLNVSGEIGDYVVDHDIDLDGRSPGLEFTYSSTKSVSDDGSMLERRRWYFDGDDPVVRVGSATMTYFSEAVPFQSSGRDESILVDLRFWMTFQHSELEAAQ